MPIWPWKPLSRPIERSAAPAGCSTSANPSAPCTSQGSGAWGASSAARATGPLPGPPPPDDRVEIGAVAVKERARSVHRRGDLEDLVLEETAGVRVGQHQRCDI